MYADQSKTRRHETFTKALRKKQTWWHVTLYDNISGKTKVKKKKKQLHRA